jgi:alkanesulfonate monooxygenase SsuD/methylene tetrahydromethanopterin reductase-like flavin-dependent oxidoreductase (luciferase family)
MAEPLHLAVALDGAGWHPAAWREPSARPNELLSARYWASLAATAERGLLDLLTIEDGFGLQSSNFYRPDGRVDQVRGRLDAQLIAARIAPLTTHIGLVPTAVTTHTEPFHLASAFATLDHVSRGRAGFRPQVSGRASDARHVGRREVPAFDLTVNDATTEQFVADLFDEAADVVDVVRRLWDSWEDDAIIKDVETGRFVDRDKLHYLDFSGRFFSVKGPSIVPRPPQGNPLVVALAHSRVPIEFAARSADVVLVTPADTAAVAGWVQQVRDAEVAVGRTGEPLRVLGDLVVFLDATESAARARKERLDTLDGARWRSDAAIFTGTAEGLADQLLAWQAEGLDGVRLRPGVIGHDLDAVVDGLVPVLQRAGAFRTSYAEATLRARFGLPRRPSRYAKEPAA